MMGKVLLVLWLALVVQLAVGAKVDLEFCLSHPQHVVESELGMPLPVEISGLNYTRNNLIRFFQVVTVPAAPVPVPETMAEPDSNNITVPRLKRSFDVGLVVQGLEIVCRFFQCERLFTESGNVAKHYGIYGETRPQGLPWTSVSGFQSKRSIHFYGYLLKNGFNNQCAEVTWWVEYLPGGQIDGVQGALLSGIDIKVKKGEAWPCWIDLKEYKVSTPRNIGTPWWPIAEVDVVYSVKDRGNRYSCKASVRGNGEAWSHGGKFCGANRPGAIQGLGVPEGSGGDGGGCLWGGNLVASRAGMERRLIRDLNPGDMVVSSSGEDEPVLVLIPHDGSEVSASLMVRLVFTSGRSLVATPDHFVHVKDRGVIRFDQVQEGDQVLGAADALPERVIESARSWKRGLYSPLTPSCAFVAEGGVVSCATASTWRPAVIRAALKPLHLLHAILPTEAYKIVHDECFLPTYALMKHATHFTSVSAATLLSSVVLMRRALLAGPK